MLRLTAIRVASTFRTVSGDAVNVIADMMPVNITAGEAKRLFMVNQIEAMTQEDERRECAGSMPTCKRAGTHHRKDGIECNLFYLA